MFKKYNEANLDVFRELINIGGGHVATSISQLIQQPVKMEVPFIEIMNYRELFNEVMGEDEEVYAVMNQIYGGIEGVFLFILTTETTNELMSIMLPGTFEDDIKMYNSTVKELFNIIVNSFLNAVSKILEKELTSSTPILTIDMFGSVISSLYMELGKYDDQMLIIKNEFYYANKKMESSLYFIPNEGALEKII